MASFSLCSVFIQGFGFAVLSGTIFGNKGGNKRFQNLVALLEGYLYNAYGNSCELLDYPACVKTAVVWCAFSVLYERAPSGLRRKHEVGLGTALLETSGLLT